MLPAKGAVPQVVNTGKSKGRSSKQKVASRQLTLKQVGQKLQQNRLRKPPKAEAVVQEQESPNHSKKRGKVVAAADATAKAKVKVRVAKAAKAGKAKAASAKAKTRNQPRLPKAANASQHVFGAQTKLVGAFEWPQKCYEALGEDGKKPVHLNLYTEFSGGLTPEFCAHAFSGNSGGNFRVSIKSQADWASTSQELMRVNADNYNEECQSVLTLLRVVSRFFG